MPLNVLVLPLLGGYIFVSKCNRFRFDSRRFSGQRLLFHSAVAGVGLLVAALLLTRLLNLFLPVAGETWRTYTQLSVPYAGTSALAFLLGCVAWWPLNKLFFKKRKEERRAIEMNGDYLEMLLDGALRNTVPVSLTLLDGKVYVGLITSNFDPAFDRKHIRLLPTLSGYRNSETKEVTFTHNYSSILQSVKNNPEQFQNVDEDQFEIVIPVAEVRSAKYFNPEVYKLFKQAQQARTASAPVL